MYGPPLAIAMFRSHANVDETKCLGCGLCVKTCPAGAVRLGEKRTAAVDDLVCGGCYKCVRRCPVQAISIQHTRCG